MYNQLPTAAVTNDDDDRMVNNEPSYRPSYVLHGSDLDDENEQQQQFQPGQLQYRNQQQQQQQQQQNAEAMPTMPWPHSVCANMCQWTAMPVRAVSAYTTYAIKTYIYNYSGDDTPGHGQYESLGQAEDEGGEEDDAGNHGHGKHNDDGNRGVVNAAGVTAAATSSASSDASSSRRESSSDDDSSSSTSSSSSSSSDSDSRDDQDQQQQQQQQQPAIGNKNNNQVARLALNEDEDAFFAGLLKDDQIPNNTGSEKEDDRREKEDEKETEEVKDSKKRRMNDIFAKMEGKSPNNDNHTNDTSFFNLGGDNTHSGGSAANGGGSCVGNFGEEDIDSSSPAANNFYDSANTTLSGRRRVPKNNATMDAQYDLLSNETNHATRQEKRENAPALMDPALVQFLRKLEGLSALAAVNVTLEPSKRNSSSSSSSSSSTYSLSVTGPIRVNYDVPYLKKFLGNYHFSSPNDEEQKENDADDDQDHHPDAFLLDSLAENGSLLNPVEAMDAIEDLLLSCSSSTSSLIVVSNIDTLKLRNLALCDPSSSHNFQTSSNQATSATDAAADLFFGGAASDGRNASASSQNQTDEKHASLPSTIPEVFRSRCTDAALQSAAQNFESDYTVAEVRERVGRFVTNLMSMDLSSGSDDTPAGTGGIKYLHMRECAIDTYALSHWISFPTATIASSAAAGCCRRIEHMSAEQCALGDPHIFSLLRSYAASRRELQSRSSSSCVVVPFLAGLRHLSIGGTFTVDAIKRLLEALVEVIEFWEIEGSGSSSSSSADVGAVGLRELSVPERHVDTVRSFCSTNAALKKSLQSINGKAVGGAATNGPGRLGGGGGTSGRLGGVGSKLGGGSSRRRGGGMAAAKSFL